MAEQEAKEAVWPFPTYEEITPKDEPKPHHPDTHPYLKEGFKYPPGWMFQPPLVAKVEEPTPITNEEIDAQLDKDLNAGEELSDEEKEARRRWKEENPDSTIKQQEYLLDVGRIDKLPWEDDSKKKSKYITREDNQQVKKTKD